MCSVFFFLFLFTSLVIWTHPRWGDDWFLPAQWRDEPLRSPYPAFFLKREMNNKKNRVFKACKSKYRCFSSEIKALVLCRAQQQPPSCPAVLGGFRGMAPRCWMEARGFVEPKGSLCSGETRLIFEALHALTVVFLFFN